MDQGNLSLEQLTKNLITELGIEGEPEEAQVYLLEKLGRNIFVRIGVSVYEAVPQEKHSELDRLMEAGDFAAFKEFAKPYIPDFDTFAQTEARKEIDEVKRLMQEEE